MICWCWTWQSQMQWLFTVYLIIVVRVPHYHTGKTSSARPAAPCEGLSHECWVLCPEWSGDSAYARCRSSGVRQGLPPESAYARCRSLIRLVGGPSAGRSVGRPVGRPVCAKRAAWKQPACCILETASPDIHVLRGFASWLQSVKGHMWRQAFGMRSMCIAIGSTHQEHLVSHWIRWTKIDWAAYVSSWVHVGIEVMYIACIVNVLPMWLCFVRQRQLSIVRPVVWPAAPNIAIRWSCADSKPSASVRTMLLDVGSFECSQLQSIIFGKNVTGSCSRSSKRMFGIYIAFNFVSCDMTQHQMVHNKIS